MTALDHTRAALHALLPSVPARRYVSDLLAAAAGRLADQLDVHTPRETIIAAHQRMEVLNRLRALLSDSPGPLPAPVLHRVEVPPGSAGTHVLVPGVGVVAVRATGDGVTLDIRAAGPVTVLVDGQPVHSRPG